MFNLSSVSKNRHSSARMRFSLLALLAVLGCSSQDGEKPLQPIPSPSPESPDSGTSDSTTPATMAPDQTSFEATWKPETVVLDAATIQSKLVNPGATDGIYQFDASLTQLADLAPGQVLVLTGVDLVKVTSVEVLPNAILVSTTPASLVDAATDVNASWDIGADLSQPVAIAPTLPSLRTESAPTALCEPDSDGGPCLPKLTFSGKLGNLDASQQFIKNPDGSLKMTLTIKYPEAGGAVLSVAGTALLLSFRQRGEITLAKGGQIQGFFGLDRVDLDLDLSVGAVAMGTSDNTFKYPLELTFPFGLGPLPAYFKLGGKIALNPSLSSTSSARSHVRYHVAGNIGVKVVGTDVTVFGSLPTVDEKLPSATDTDTVSTVTAGLGVMVEFPRVTFGIGVAKVAASEGFLVGKSEVVINEVIRLDGMGLIAGNCTTVNANVGAYAGGTLRLLGKSFTQEKQIFGATHQAVKAGNPTMAMCD